MSLRQVLRTEVRVAVSLKAQPIWFRVLKWTVLLSAVAYYWRSPSLWWWLGAACGLSLIVHLVWRTKTKQWTEPWGGWNDLDAARRVERRDDDA